MKKNNQLWNFLAKRALDNYLQLRARRKIKKIPSQVVISTVTISSHFNHQVLIIIKPAIGHLYQPPLLAGSASNLELAHLLLLAREDDAVRGADVLESNAGNCGGRLVMIIGEDEDERGIDDLRKMSVAEQEASMQALAAV